MSQAISDRPTVDEARPIDIARESVIRLADACKLIPSSRPGKGVNISTVNRWVLDGSHGVKLEALRVPGGWITSREAVQRFLERMTAAYGAGAAPRPVTPTERRRAAERADRELEAMGV